jgi:hypothetical protein
VETDVQNAQVKQPETPGLKIVTTAASSDKIGLRRLRDHRAPPVIGEEPCLAKYFMNLRDGTEELLDPDGVDYASLDELRKAVLVTVRDLISGDLREGLIDFRLRIDAEDANGVIVYTLPFKHAVKIIPDTVGYAYD